MSDSGKSLLAAKRVRHEISDLSRFQLWRIRQGRKHYLRHERREGWTGDLPIYLFWCGKCKRISLDYPHGLIQNRYLTCQNQNCRTNTDFVPWWVAWVELWEIVKTAWRLTVKGPNR